MPEIAIVYVNPEGLEKTPKAVPDRNVSDHARVAPPNTVGFYYTVDGVRSKLTYYINPHFASIEEVRADGNYGELLAQLEEQKPSGAERWTQVIFPTAGGALAGPGFGYDPNFHREVKVFG